MSRKFLMATAALAALTCSAQAQQDYTSSTTGGTIETVTVTAQRLSDARADIQTQLGASTYTVTAQDILNTPGGDNTLLNQVLLQMPDVAQILSDSFTSAASTTLCNIALTASSCPKASACSAKRSTRGSRNRSS